MKVMKKLLSLCLVLSMLCAMALPAMAAEADFVVTTDKSTYEVGETAYVTLTLNTTFTVANVNMRIWYDPNVFTYDAEKSTIGEELNKLMLKNLTNPVESNYSSEPNYTEKGWKPINVSGAYLGRDIAIGSGTLATLAFEVTAACESAVFEHTIIQLNTADASTSYKETATSVSATVTVQDAAVAVTGITLDKSELALTEGETGTLTATVTPENATDKTVTWSSSDESVATVADGTVTAVAAGTATITAKAGDVEAACTVTVTEKQEEIPAAGYTVSATNAVSITAGENAEVIITVTETESKAYNAYELNVTYPEGLTYVSASGSGVEGDNFQAEHDGENRTIQIIGYGAEKDSGTAAAKLTFTGSATGEYDVTISSAKVDAAASAPTQDTPDATITDAVTKITVTGYTVTLGEGLTADSTVAYPGTDFTFEATDADNYDYTVTAKVGETMITVNDNKDGTYTIPGADITGNITVSAVMNPKSYDVTYDGTTTENAATYNTPYTFTPAKDGYAVGGVTVKIGGEAYTGYSNVDGTYTIPGAAITGDIVITVEWIEETPSYVTITKSEGVIGGDTATEGTDYTFSFGDTDNYEYDEETLVVKVGDTDITDQVTKNEETGEYTIPGDLITGHITISIERTAKATFTVEVSEYLTLDEGNKMYLVTVKGVEDGKVAKYDGQNMFWSAQTLTTGENGEETTGYGAYAWLVISNEGLDAVKTAASGKVSTAEGTTNLTVDYSGDVNGTEKVDVNDAQLVYNMYKAYYGDFTTVSMQKFLDADVNSDQTVNVTDAAAVVTAIINAK